MTDGLNGLRHQLIHDIAGLEEVASECPEAKDELVGDILLDFLGLTVDTSAGKDPMKDLLLHLNQSVELCKKNCSCKLTKSEFPTTTRVCFLLMTYCLWLCSISSVTPKT